MARREAQFQTKFGDYLKAKGLFCNFELKETPVDELYVNDDRLKRQCESLLAAEEEGYYWKHSDQDSRMKPFDGSYIPPQKGYIVIKYPDFFCMIHIKVFMKEVQEAKGMYLLSERARELAERVILG